MFEQNLLSQALQRILNIFHTNRYIFQTKHFFEIGLNEVGYLVNEDSYVRGVIPAYSPLLLLKENPVSILWVVVQLNRIAQIFSYTWNGKYWVFIILPSVLHLDVVKFLSLHHFWKYLKISIREIVKFVKSIILKKPKNSKL